MSKIKTLIWWWWCHRPAESNHFKVKPKTKLPGCSKLLKIPKQLLEWRGAHQKLVISLIHEHVLWQQGNTLKAAHHNCKVGRVFLVIIVKFLLQSETVFQAKNLKHWFHLVYLNSWRVAAVEMDSNNYYDYSGKSKRPQRTPGISWKDFKWWHLKFLPGFHC